MFAPIVKDLLVPIEMAVRACRTVAGIDVLALAPSG